MPPQRPLSLLRQQQGGLTPSASVGRVGGGESASLFRRTQAGIGAPQTSKQEKLSTIGGPEPTGAAFRFLETLRTPQAAAFSAVTAALDPDLGFGEVFEKRPTFRDVLNAGGMPEFAGRGLVEFAGDVVFDPINFVPFFGLGRKGLQIAGKGGMKGLRALDRVGVPTQGAVEGLTRAFRGAIGADGRLARKMAVQSQRDVRFATGHLAKLMDERTGQMAKFASELDIPIDDLRRAVDARVEDKIGKRLDDLNVGQNLLDELGASGEPIFDVGHIARVAREGGGFDPRGPSYLPAKMNIPPLSPAGEELIEPMVRELKEGAIDLLLKEKASGLAAKELDSQRLDYLLHITHPDARKILLKNPVFRAVGRSWNPQHASLLARELRDVSINEINELAIKGMLDITDYTKGVPLFVDAPEVLDALRGYRGARAMASAKLFDDVAEKFGVKVPQTVGKTGAKREALDAVAQRFGLEEGASYAQVRKALKTDPKNYRQLSAKGLENTWVPGEVADVVDKYFDVVRNPNMLQKGLEHVLNVQNGWKAWTLAVFPEYHTRNAVGNVWNNFLAGIKNPAWYSKAAELQSIVRKGNIEPSLVKRLTAAGGSGVKSTDDVIRVGDATYRVQDLLDEMAEHGVLRGGIFGAEIDTAGREIISATQGGARAVLRGSAGPVKYGFKIGQEIEDNARIAHYMWKRSKGASVEDAAASVKKFLFNYDELDPFTEAARTVMPFLTWSRFNIPLQLEHLVVSPHKAAAINKMRVMIENMDPVSFGPVGEAVGIPGVGGGRDRPDERFVADWVRENMGIRVRRSGPNNYDFFLLENWIPLADLSEIGLPELENGIGAMAKKAGDFATGLLTPAIIVPVELMTGKSLFLDRDFLPERREFLGADVPEPLINALRTIRVLSVLDRFVAPPKGSSFGQEAMRTLTGIKVVPQDLKAGRRMFFGRASVRERELASAHRRALDNGRTREAARLWREILDLRRTKKRPR